MMGIMPAAAKQKLYLMIVKLREDRKRVYLPPDIHCYVKSILVHPVVCETLHSLGSVSEVSNDILIFDPFTFNLDFISIRIYSLYYAGDCLILEFVKKS